MKLEALEERLGYTFTDKSLLRTALTHSSYANELRGEKAVCNERLEFLGDSVLGMTVAKHLYLHYPDMPEGKMTKLRAELVCEQSLVWVARRLQLGDFLYLGKGELRGGGRHRASILADAMEAVFAAILLDGGTEQVEAIILGLFQNYLTETAPTAKDYKTALQELAQKKSGQSLSYHLIRATGPDHQKTFAVEVCLNGQAIGQGEGHSKKEAEQAAAAAALDRFQTG